MNREQWEADPVVQCVLNMDRVDDWGAMNDAEVAEYEDKAAQVRTLIREAVDEALEAAAVEIDVLLRGPHDVIGITHAARIVRSHKETP